jgi:hypothetical protein
MHSAPDPARLEALARAMYPAIFGEPAPPPRQPERCPAPVVSLAAYRARLEELER